VPEGPPNRRGRRNPSLAAELAAAQRIAQQKEQGVVRRRDPEPEDEQYDEPAMEPVETDLLPDGELPPDELPMLYPGDIVIARRSSSTEIDGTEHWFSYGVSTRVQPHENEEDTFGRVLEVVNTRVEDIIDEATETIQRNIERRREEERRRPIQPTRGR
jgi:hypothetical protein